MKHIFVINPAAGKGIKIPSLLSSITYACQELQVEYEIYHTTTVGDGTRFVSKMCETYPDTPLRFYACGGDGTLNEVVSGAVGHPNAEVGVVPIGTGNDFVKAFSCGEHFLDIKRQILGKSIQTDLIRFNSQYCINVLNIGFDCDVVQKTAEIKRSAFVPQNLAYLFGVVGVFSRPIGKLFKVMIDGKELMEREFVLCAIANANFYGGGFKVAPNALLNDGYMDLCLVDRVSHMTFAKMISKYKAGKHINPDDTTAAPYIHYRKCKAITIEAEAPMGFCTDGEVFPYKRATVEVLPRALSVIVPKGSRCRALLKEPAGEPVPV